MDSMQMPGQAGQVMGKKVGGKMSIGQYFGVVKKWYMWLVIAAVVVGALSLIPGLYLTMAFVGWIVSIFGAITVGMFGYKLAKEHSGELKDVLIGGAVLGGVVGIITAIFSAIAGVIFFNTVTSGLGVFGVGYGAGATGSVIIGAIFGIIWALVGGLVTALIGFAIGGGFNKTGTPAAR
ncbi:MAG: hypothetical protein U0514_04180 [Candidatus Andersenbacteria bacterium]